MEKARYMAILAIVVGPIIKEILFRGIIFSSFENATKFMVPCNHNRCYVRYMAPGSFIQGVYTANLWHSPSLLHEKLQIAGVCCIAHGINNLSGTFATFTRYWLY